MGQKPKTLAEWLADADLASQFRATLTTTAARIAEEWPDRVGMWVQGVTFDSPLEVLFAGWWHAIVGVYEIGHGRMFRLVPQFQVRPMERRYRLDFVIELANPDQFADAARVFGATFPKMAVELDGHDYHERTKEQVTARNQRDRELQQDGWRVFHISGSELYRDGYKAVEEIYLAAHDAMTDLAAAQFQAESRP